MDMQKVVLAVCGIVVVAVAYLVSGWGAELLRTLQTMAEALQQIASKL